MPQSSKPFERLAAIAAEVRRIGNADMSQSVSLLLADAAAAIDKAAQAQREREDRLMREAFSK